MSPSGPILRDFWPPTLGGQNCKNCNCAQCNHAVVLPSGVANLMSIYKGFTPLLCHHARLSYLRRSGCISRPLYPCCKVCQFLSLNTPSTSYIPYFYMIQHSPTFSEVLEMSLLSYLFLGNRFASGSLLLPSLCADLFIFYRGMLYLQIPPILTCLQWVNHPLCALFTQSFSPSLTFPCHFTGLCWPPSGSSTGLIYTPNPACKVNR